MKWQEYQNAVAALYEQLQGVGTVRRSCTLPDLQTGQPRQLDCVVEIESKGHRFLIVIDAKFHSDPIDSPVVESVCALSNSVGAAKAVVVAANGWTEPAFRKATALRVDLRRLSLEGALDLLVPEKWQMCPACAKDCVVLDQEGGIEYADGTFSLWLAGQCRECRSGLVVCQECGDEFLLELGSEYECYCGHVWGSTSGSLTLAFRRGSQLHLLAHLIEVPPKG